MAAEDIVRITSDMLEGDGVKGIIRRLFSESSLKIAEENDDHVTVRCTLGNSDRPQTYDLVLDRFKPDPENPDKISFAYLDQCDIGSLKNMLKGNPDIDAAYCYFDGKLDYSHMLFRNVSFKASIFREDVDFMGATFEKKADFGGTTFKGDADFGGTTFKGDVCFGGTTFKRDADFGSTLVTYVGFRRSMFGGYANFRRSVFEGNATFNGTLFKEDVDFMGTTFEKKADFGGTTFEGDVDFGGTTAGTYDDFWRTMFKGDAAFNGSVFKRKANFTEAVFRGGADFGGTVFERKASFARTAFRAAAVFARSAFRKDVYFHDSTFSGKTSFSRSEAKRISFEGVIFESVVDLNWKDFESVNILGTVFRSHVSIDWNARGVEGSILKKLEEVSDKGADLKEKYKNICKEFIILKEKYRSQGEYEFEDGAYVAFKRMERKTLGPSDYALSWFEDGIGKYGTSPKRVAIWMPIIVICFGLIYSAIGVWWPNHFAVNGNAISVISESFYTSGIIFITIGFSSDMHIIETLPKVLVVTEGFIGLFMMAYFTICFSRKVLR